jgi:murein DD-endopeptidase MepM/ murein hydrolase activator NlpD
MGPGIPSAIGHVVSPTVEPPSVATSVEPLSVVHLRLPDLPTHAEYASVQPVVSSLRAASYTVAAGDTLWGIAKLTGVRVEALAAANHLSDANMLRAGRVLTIPATGAAAPPGAVSGGAVSRPRPVRTRAAALSFRAVGSSAQAPAPVAMLWPSRGIVTSRFGWRVHPIFGSREFHTGVDIAARTGTIVVAARTGVVRFVGWKTGYGRIIVVEHDGGIETSYSHLSAAVVNPGDHVTQGEVIGRVGSTGWSTGPHLLFEVRRNGVPVDPAAYLNQHR